MEVRRGGRRRRRGRQEVSASCSMFGGWSMDVTVVIGSRLLPRTAYKRHPLAPTVYKPR